MNRLERLELEQPSQGYNGAIRFTWDGPKDDERLAKATAQAEAENKLLIVRTIVDPKAVM